jgi:hypothetical protein
MAKSFIGYVTACRGQLLLGGTSHHKSSRFATQEDAQAWVSVVVKTNCEAGRLPGAWGWERVEQAPEIAAQGE